MKNSKIQLLAIFILSSCAATKPANQTVAGSGSFQPKRHVASTGAYVELVSYIAIGPSVPKTDANLDLSPQDTVALAAAPSRASGGENFKVSYLDTSTKNPASRKIAQIKLFAYSKSGQGQILVHDVQSDPAQPADVFAPLSQYSAIASSARAQNHDGQVLLAPGNSVAITPLSQPTINDLSLTVEAFGNDDASLLVQVVAVGDADDPQVTAHVGRTLVGSAGSGSGASSGGNSHPAPSQGACVRSGKSCGSGDLCCEGSCFYGICNGSGQNCVTGNGTQCSDSSPCCTGNCFYGVCVDNN